MKGFIKLHEEDGDTFLIRFNCIRHIFKVSGEMSLIQLGFGHKFEGDVDKWHNDIITVRESPSEIARLIEEAQAPTVDEIAAGAIGGAVGILSALVANGLTEQQPTKAIVASTIYEAAEALVAERRRRNSGEASNA